MPILNKKENLKDNPEQFLDAKEKKPKETGKKKRLIASTSQAFRILRNPLITEKGTNLNILNKYIFEVETRANKNEIKKAVGEIYDVHVVKVNVLNFKGKSRRYGGGLGKTRKWKKAVVTLKAGETIKLFEGV